MRNLKKFLALVLAMMMAFSLMVTANAANEADNGSNQYTDKQTISEEFVEAVDVLYGMGIMTGDYGAFKGNQSIMRSEMATVLYRLMTGDTNQLKNQLYADIAAERFTDVNASDWFAPYIGWCYDAGIMVGNNGYFRPWANVTGYETLVMVLRAMGYGKNHEYTGIGWNVNASSDGTVVGLLADVNNSHYANTLSQPTRRDVVASIVFQAAQLPVVTWTTSLGYNKYQGVAIAQGTNKLNPSLGETYFGLTCAKGIVVGNQATGESVTKIGFTSAPIKGTVNVPGSVQNRVGQYAYVYASNAMIAAASTDGNGNPIPAVYAGNSTQSFDWTTDLTLFNHAVKVWYNWNGGNHKTYALYDETTATAIVTDDEQTATNLTPALVGGLADGTADEFNNWDATKMDATRTNAYFNYAFAAMGVENYAANAGAAYTTALSGSALNGKAISAVSPIKDNDESTANEHGLYLLISNSPDKGVDVVISLDMTMTKVVQANTTTAPLSVGVYNSNGVNNTTKATMSANGYFGAAADVAMLTAAGGTGADANYVSLLKDNLLNTSEDAQKLNTKVAAIEITGTTGPSANGGIVASTNTGDDTFGTASTHNTNFTSTYYYQLTVPQYKTTAKVIKVDTVNQDVYLDTGKVLHQSVFAEDTDATFTTDIEGWEATAGFRLIAGREYTFTLDAADGNYIYWETPAVTSNFVYGTYIDWETVTASSLFDYPLVYVNTNGDRRQVADISSINGTAMGIQQYNDINLPKRDAAAGNNSGFVKGIYIGYALNSSTGALTTNLAGTGFVQGQAPSGSSDFGDAAVTIDSTSVTLGAEPTNDAALFLTENTQFYIVDGAGTENQTVTPYKGISELMKDMSQVVIHGEWTSGTLTAKWGNYIDGTMVDGTVITSASEMFYYQAGRFDYDQNYDASALEVKTIYLPAPCVDFQRSTTTSLVFVGDSDATLINSNNGNWATQFTVYSTKGEASDVWIEGRYDTAGNDAYDVYSSGDNVFYELRDSGKKATDDKPIYKIAAVNNAASGDVVIGQYWDGTTVQVTTATLVNGAPALYRATTYNQQAAYIDDATEIATVVSGGAYTADLYNVGSAGIKNLNTRAYPGILDNNLSTLNGAGSLATNNGVPVSCILNANSDITVDFIFVNA